MLKKRGWVRSQRAVHVRIWRGCFVLQANRSPLEKFFFFLKESDIWLIFHTDHAYSDPSSPPRNSCSPTKNSCPGSGDSERIQNNIPGDATGIEDWIKEERVPSEEKRRSGFSLWGFNRWWCHNWDRKYGRKIRKTSFLNYRHYFFFFFF